MKIRGLRRGNFDISISDYGTGDARRYRRRAFKVIVLRYKRCIDKAQAPSDAYTPTDVTIKYEDINATNINARIARYKD